MKIRMRNYQWDRDFEVSRAFLGEMYPIRTAHSNWIPSTLENVKFGPGGTEYLDDEDEYLKIWEEFDETKDAALRIIALSFTKPSGECWLSIHPEYMSEFKGIVRWMEGRVRELMRDEDKEAKLNFVVDDEDEERIRLLSEMEYQKAEMEGDKQVRPVDAPVPDYSLPEGYTIRHAIVKEDYLEYREVQKAVFPHIKDMSKKQLQLYSSASFYKEDLDIVAVDPEDNFAAFCTVRIDPLSKIAELEPVGTHPDHRKLGLGKAVICEGLKRVKKYKPSAMVIIGAAPSEGARRLYESVGFVNKGTRHSWVKKS
ncbi:MAG: GNAT family N-acetyltransferase [Candidatus Thorarchaeota archaeon]|jgi:ribosomal protein S18 acetylase RimI-like enzyme